VLAATPEKSNFSLNEVKFGTDKPAAADLPLFRGGTNQSKGHLI